MSRNALTTVPSQPHTLLIEPREVRKGERPQVDLLVDQLLKRDDTVESTVDDILGHAQVRKHGMLGRLSSSQQSLVTSVVSIMQDRISADARKNAQALRQIIHAEREALQNVSRTFAETARHLYQLPLLGMRLDEAPPPNRPGAPAEAAYTPPSPRPLYVRLLTWGNLLALTAVCLAVFTVRTSIATADFEARYHMTQTSLDELKVAYHELQLDLETARRDGKRLTEQNTGLQTQLADVTARQQSEQARLQGELKRQTQQASELQDTLARQQALLSQSELAGGKARQKLLDDIADLKESLASARGRESKTDQNTQMWKDLANERKAEIEKLRTKLSERGVDPDKKSGFMGLF